jgi:polyhydroxybutyrate depolymerase
MFIYFSPLVSQTFLDRTLIHDGETREYKIYIPSSYQENVEAPLLFNFHGGSGDIESQIFISDMRSLADDAGFILVYPQALGDPNDGGSTSWTHKEPSSIDDIFFVEAMINEVSFEYNINKDRVYACGYSNGGEFSYELACRLSNKIAAIGVVARSMYIETFDICNPSHPTAVVTIHGTNDDYNGISFGGFTYYISLDDVNNYWSNYNNTDPNPTINQLPNLDASDGSTVEHISWRNGDGCVSVDHFKVIDGGHDWPGSFGNMDIDASSEIWNFVSKYDINGLIECTPNSVSTINKRDDFQIFPNPVNDHLIIDIKIDSPNTYEIYSHLGQKLLFGKISNGQQTIDISNLKSGIYFLRIGNRTKRFMN